MRRIHPDFPPDWTVADDVFLRREPDDEDDDEEDEDDADNDDEDDDETDDGYSE
jgi:hypothetical protein